MAFRLAHRSAVRVAVKPIADDFNQWVEEEPKPRRATWGSEPGVLDILETLDVVLYQFRPDATGKVVVPHTHFFIQVGSTSTLNLKFTYREPHTEGRYESLRVEVKLYDRATEDTLEIYYGGDLDLLRRKVERFLNQLRNLAQIGNR